MPLRVVRGISTHFPTRAGEWWLAAILTGWGFRLLMADNVFDQASFAALARFFSEETWGGMCLTVGLLRLTALTVNGTLWDIESLRKSRSLLARFGVTYSRFSPHVRAGMALAGCFFWFSISFGLILTGTLGTGICVYPVLFFADVWNASQASVDADRVHRNVPA